MSTPRPWFRKTGTTGRHHRTGGEKRIGRMGGGEGGGSCAGPRGRRGRRRRGRTPGASPCCIRPTSAPGRGAGRPPADGGDGGPIHWSRPSDGVSTKGKGRRTKRSILVEKSENAFYSPMIRFTKKGFLCGHPSIGTNVSRWEATAFAREYTHWNAKLQRLVRNNRVDGAWGLDAGWPEARGLRGSGATARSRGS